MYLNLDFLKITIILIAFSARVCSANQPSYQVSLYVHLHPQEPPIHLCNGVIVQSRLILTTASCVHYKFFSNNSLGVPIEPNKISVISGSSTKYNEELTLQISDIFVANNFNYTTGANDLALLRLNDILRLDTRKDISWITLEDDKEYGSPCLANFNVRNSLNGASNYIQSEHLPILDAKSCKVIAEHLGKHENDICSLYYPPTGFDCNALENLQNYNGDRGTGLVCGNKLTGLLSTILPWQNITDCKEKPLRAYYTAIAPHIPWIFNIITEEDLKMFNEGEYISSSPYVSETNAFVEPLTTESETTTVYTAPVNLQTNELAAQNINAAALRSTNCELSTIFGIIFLIAKALGCWLL